MPGELFASVLVASDHAQLTGIWSDLAGTAF
jgi:hypothetical protein